MSSTQNGVVAVCPGAQQPQDTVSQALGAAHVSPLPGRRTGGLAIIQTVLINTSKIRYYILKR